MADALPNELETAIKELELARREIKKLTRSNSMLEGIINRNKEVAAAKDNLTNTIRAERSKQEQFMNLLLENCPDIILMFDQHERFVYCTDLFLRRAAIPAFGMINGRTYAEVFSRFASDEWIGVFGEAYRRAMSEKNTYALEASLDIDQSGHFRNYAIQITPMTNEQGMAAGALALFHDLTDIVQAKRQAEKANNAKSDFLATVSHEIRTPMNAIIGVSEILRKTGLNEQQSGYVHNIQSSSYVLLNLINDILDFSKIEAGKLELIEDYFDLLVLLKHLETMFAVMFEGKRILFLCDFSSNLPRVVFGDEKRVGQVLTNILNNALKYTESGAVWFRAYAKQDGRIRFDVRDTGIGIHAEDMPKLFTAFEQLDKVKNKNVVGTGLGLAISSKLCAMMDGVISIQSEYGVGSCFSVEIRLRQGSDGDLKQETVEDIEFTAPDARVLVVDDIEINLLVADSMLEEYGITPDDASSGKAALKLVESKEYDLIFMDHMMPEMDGVEAVKKIRALGGHNAEVPIVALTANAVSGAVEMFFANGFNGFLSKPIDAASMSACLVKWLPDSLIKVKSNTNPNH